MLHFDIEMGQPADMRHFIIHHSSIFASEKEQIPLKNYLHSFTSPHFTPIFGLADLLVDTANVTRKMNDQKFANQIETSVIEFDVNIFERCVNVCD